MVLQNLVVLYGIGGLSDVGRHAIVAALEKKDDVGHITIITKFPELIEDETCDWNCGCCAGKSQHKFTQDDWKRITLIKLEKDLSWNEIDLSTYLLNAGTTKIISCLGNRQPFFGHYDSFEGNNALIRAIETIHQDGKTKDAYRVVVMTSMGLNEDWPAVEFNRLISMIMFLIYTVFARTMYHDLRTMELLYREKGNTSSTPEKKMIIDYLLVRPMGLSEDIVPSNQWLLQKEKYKHPIGIEVAKLDVARYMLNEVLSPTLHQTAIAIGSDPTLPLEKVKK